MANDATFPHVLAATEWGMEQPKRMKIMPALEGYHVGLPSCTQIQRTTALSICFPESRWNVYTGQSVIKKSLSPSLWKVMKSRLICQMISYLLSLSFLEHSWSNRIFAKREKGGGRHRRILNPFIDRSSPSLKSRRVMLRWMNELSERRNKLSVWVTGHE